MPQTVFPAPGSTSGTQQTTAFSSFILPSGISKLQSSIRVRSTRPISTSTSVVNKISWGKDKTQVFLFPTTVSTAVKQLFSIKGTSNNPVTTGVNLVNKIRWSSDRSQLFYASPLSTVSKIPRPLTSVVISQPVNKIDTFKTPFFKTSVFYNYTLNVVDTLVSQSTVSTKTAPTNPRENLFYFNLAPGIRNGHDYIVDIGKRNEYTNITALDSFIAQSTVSTKTAPTNPRENLFYFNLAPGIRNGSENQISPASFIFQSTNSLETFIAQSTVSTTTSPISSRENLYYFNISPAIRNSTETTVDASWALPITVQTLTKQIEKVNQDSPNRYSALNLTTFVAQSTVSTIVAPTNARENLYYFNISPAIRNSTETTVDIGGRVSLQIAKVSSTTILKSDNSSFKTSVIKVTSPLIAISDKIQNSSQLKTFSTNNIGFSYYDLGSGNINKRMFALQDYTANLGSGNINKRMFALQDYTAKFETYNVTNYLSQFDQAPVNIFSSNTPHDNLFLFRLLPNRRSIGRLDIAVPFVTVTVPSTDKLQSSTVLKGLSNELVVYKNGKLVSTAILTAIDDKNEISQLLKYKLSDYSIQAFEFNERASVLQKQLNPVSEVDGILNITTISRPNEKIVLAGRDRLESGRVSTTAKIANTLENLLFATINKVNIPVNNYIFTLDPSVLKIKSTTPLRIATNDTLLLPNGKVSSMAVIKDIPSKKSFFDINFIEPVKLGPQYLQMFDFGNQQGNLSKQLTQIKSAEITRLSVNKLNAAVIVRPSDTRRYLPTAIEELYQQSNVSLNISPANARENLFYFNISPGIRYRSLYPVTDSGSTLNVQLLNKPFEQVKGDSSPKLDTPKLILGTIKPVEIINKDKIVTNIDNYFSQIDFYPVGGETGVRGNLFYFNLAPGLRTTNKALLTAISSETPTVAKLNPFLNVQGLAQEYFLLDKFSIERLKIPTVFVAKSPELSQAEKLKTGNFKLGSSGIFDPAVKSFDPIQFWS